MNVSMISSMIISIQDQSYHYQSNSQVGTWIFVWGWQVDLIFILFCELFSESII